MTNSLRRRVAKVEAERQTPGGLSPVSIVFAHDDEPAPPVPEGNAPLVVHFISPEWAKANPDRLAR